MRRTERLAFALLIGHLVLLCVGGRDYAKVHVLGPLYVTEVVLLATAALSWRAIAAVPWDRITNLVALFVAFGACWAVVGGVGDEAGVKAFSFFVYSLFYFIVRGLARDDAARWRVLHAIAFATIAGALLGIVHVMTGRPVFDPSAHFEVTTTGSTRWLGGEYSTYAVVGMSVPAIAAIVSRRLGGVSALLLICACIELVLAQHRSAFVAAGVALVATSGFVAGSEQTARGLLQLVAFLALAVGAYLLFVGGNHLDETLFRIGETTNLEDINTGWRLQNWNEVLHEVAERPFGHGFSTWDFSFTIRDPLTGSHNDYLDLAYRIGVPGLVAFLAIPASLLVQTRRNAQLAGPMAQLLPLTVCAAMLALLVLASFNVVFESPQVSILFWILLGLGSGSQRKDPA
jgi:hypothetical protein